MTYVVVPDAAVRGGLVQLLAVLVVLVEFCSRVVRGLEDELVVRDLEGRAGAGEDGGAAEGGAAVHGRAGDGGEVFWGGEAVAMREELSAMCGAEREASSVRIGEIYATQRDSGSRRQHCLWTLVTLVTGGGVGVGWWVVTVCRRGGKRAKRVEAAAQVWGAGRLDVGIRCRCRCNAGWGEG